MPLRANVALLLLLQMMRRRRYCNRAHKACWRTARRCALTVSIGVCVCLRFITVIRCCLVASACVACRLTSHIIQEQHRPFALLLPPSFPPLQPHPQRRISAPCPKVTKTNHYYHLHAANLHIAACVSAIVHSPHVQKSFFNSAMHAESSGCFSRAFSYYWTLRLYRTQVWSPRAFFLPVFPAKFSV